MPRPISRRLMADTLWDALLAGVVAPLAGALAAVGLGWASVALVAWWLA